MTELIVFLAPLIGAAACLLLRPVLGIDRGPLAATAGVVLAAALAPFLLVQAADGAHWTTVMMQWVVSGPLEANWSLRIDTLSALMLVVVTFVSAGVHIYSLEYMKDDRRRDIYFANISVFTAFMILLVTSANFLQLYVGWEGVGLSSYLLINHWYEKASANHAAIKSFIVNRVGDFGFGVGILVIFFVFGSLDFDAVFSQAPLVAGRSLEVMGLEFDSITLVCLLLFLGAMGKSAQLGLHVWLPDAMEAPTPVSALIHAATMVTAGVFMLVRLSPLFELAPFARDVVVVVGALTAFMAATIAVTQFDLKRIIAYSTMSQLGLMFVAAGLSAYDAAMFHLFTHAFFKGLLFLAAGGVIHALHGQQDIRHMGGLAAALPVTCAFMAIGSCALAGLPGFSGYYSKEAILAAAWGSQGPVAQFGAGAFIVTTGLTAFYSWRLVFAVFAGPRRFKDQDHPHLHEAPAAMVVPQMALAVVAIFGGLLFSSLLVGEGSGEFWHAALVQPTLPPHHLPELVHALVTVLAFLGIAAAYVGYVARPHLPGRIAAAVRPLDRFLSNKWYFDIAYRDLLVIPATTAGRRLGQTVEGSWIDGIAANGIAAGARLMARLFSQAQTGLIYHYAFAMFATVTLLVTWQLIDL